MKLHTHQNCQIKMTDNAKCWQGSGAAEMLRTRQSALELNPHAMCEQHVRACAHPETQTTNTDQLCYVRSDNATRIR